MDNNQFYYQHNLEALNKAEDSYLDEVAEIWITCRDRFLAEGAYQRALAAYQRVVAEITQRLQPALRFAQVMEVVATLFNHGYNLSSNDDSDHQTDDNRPSWVEIYGGYVTGFMPTDVEAVEGLEAAQTAVDDRLQDDELPINWTEALEGWRPERETLRVIYQTA